MQGAVDVWYTFVATGTELQVNITGSIANPNVGIWSGNCLNLTGRGCAVGDAGGNLNETFGPLIWGKFLATTCRLVEQCTLYSR